MKSCLSYQSSIDSRQQSSASFHVIFKHLYSKVSSHPNSVDSSSMIPIAGDFRSVIQVGRRKGARVIKIALASCLPVEREALESKSVHKVRNERQLAKRMCCLARSSPGEKDTEESSEHC